MNYQRKERTRSAVRTGDARMKGTISVINGPNLNLLGEREPEIYGSTTLEQVNAQLEECAKAGGFSLRVFQSNSEGELISEIQKTRTACAGMLINPAGLTHTSVSLRDALQVLNFPVVEVHISNIYAREEFRRHSHVSQVATAVISGFGVDGYRLGLEWLIRRIGGTDSSSSSGASQ